MKDELYADGVGEITVTGSVVRIDLVSLSATEKDEKNAPKAVFRQRVIMPVDAFANAFDLMQKAMNGLVEAGAIRRVNEQPQAVAGSEPATTVKAADTANSSPNFN